MIPGKSRGTLYKKYEIELQSELNDLKKLLNR